MIAYSWNDKYLTGHAEIDAQHRHLFDVLNRLYTALKEQRGDAGIQVALDELADYVQVHFATEERVMRDNDYPGLDEHSAAHARFTREVGSMRQRGPYMHAFELLNFIGYWIVDHVGHADVAIGKHLRLLEAQGAGLRRRPDDGRAEMDG